MAVNSCWLRGDGDAAERCPSPGTTGASPSPGCERRLSPPSHRPAESLCRASAGCLPDLHRPFRGRNLVREGPVVVGEGRWGECKALPPSSPCAQNQVASEVGAQAKRVLWQRAPHSPSP